MYNATIKHAAPVALLLCALTACGGPSEEQIAAQGLLEQARALYDQGMYDSSAVIADSLCKTYPKQFDLVKEAMNARAMALEQSFTIQLEATDSVIAQKKRVVEELAGKFTYIKTEDMVEGYKILTSLVKRPLVGRTGIEPRVDEGGNLYLFSLLNGVPAKHEKLVAYVRKNKAEAAETATVAYDDIRNYRFTDINDVSNESVTFHFDECAEFCQFVVDNADKDLNLTFSGKKSHTIQLDKATKQAIVDSYTYSAAIRDGLQADMQRMLLLKKIDVAKSQVERTQLQQ